MKIPGVKTEEKTVKEEKKEAESPFLTKEQIQEKRGHDIDKIMGGPKKVSAETPEVSEKRGTESEEVIFARTYTVSYDDMGFTPAEIFERVKNEEMEPTEEDEEILKALLFDGFYEHSFKIGKLGSYSFRTISPGTIYRTEKMLEEMFSEEDRGAFMLRTAVIARALSSYLGKATCDFRNQKEFESKEAIKERMELVMSLPTAIADDMAEKLTIFGNRTRDVTRRNITNF